ncbi:Uncharacterized membrane protein [Seinonella peptonophila]|uniref:Uncharacterized membrane protein n=1 Tax=Seinonella peptonophila TaxID=112248 RepID=A0A1M4ZAK0_9BACL|nr:DUF2269 family protein [Seinonella peptonophila]SHF15089.1 Uncharacterized membrane protein [Seinonella peptonophila]
MTGWLLIHLVGVVLSIGNFIVTAFWKIRADRQKDPHVVLHSVKNVMLADYIFTLPGIIFILISGLAMAIKAGMPMSGFNWFTLSLILFGLTGILWLFILIPVQRKMIKHASKSVENGQLGTEYKKSSLHWAIAGSIATILPIVIMYFMIMKPL